MTLSIFYEWDWDQNDLVIMQKTETHYDEVGNIASVVHYFEWDPQLNDLRKYSKKDYTYNDSGNQTSSVRYEWDRYFF